MKIENYDDAGQFKTISSCKINYFFYPLLLPGEVTGQRSNAPNVIDVIDELVLLGGWD